ncbi:DarT ssDNA thymidine ADP-ribosyltransferase family protein [Providencia stuartii]|uniref:DarT ssDNA thymidine ADP-ribosyltransferase family protein n=1 Tax=Providencia stuartii TaxID=588 RepID=UPI0024AC0450|nr:DarT ssDNA thymidine ADP-ribosyltransferase family protein [Providencia stuartii]MCX3072504.1 DarT ssDNA thymidine ADP-ribosyltransferase family protein [Providencia stuartii]
MNSVYLDPLYLKVSDLPFDGYIYGKHHVNPFNGDECYPYVCYDYSPKLFSSFVKENVSPFEAMSWPTPSVDVYINTAIMARVFASLNGIERQRFLVEKMGFVEIGKKFNDDKLFIYRFCSENSQIELYINDHGDISEINRFNQQKFYEVRIPIESMLSIQYVFSQVFYDTCQFNISGIKWTEEKLGFYFDVLNISKKYPEYDNYSYDDIPVIHDLSGKCFDKKTVTLREREDLKDILNKRSIKYLCHFTPRENLKKIMTTGLLLRDESTMVVTDSSRYDMSKNICLTISEPNHWMLKRKKEMGFDLVLLILDAKVIYEKKCLFFPYNAATKSYREVDRENFSGSLALEDMFSDIVTFTKSQQETQSIKRRLFIPASVPSNNQAEVQVIEEIEPEYILDVIDGNIDLDYKDIDEHMQRKFVSKLSVNEESILNDEFDFPENKSDDYDFKVNDINKLSDSRPVNDINKLGGGWSVGDSKSNGSGCLIIIALFILIYFFR